MPNVKTITEQIQAILNEYRREVEVARRDKKPLPAFPEKVVTPHIDNTWHDSAEAIINNWIGQVYQLTDLDRNKPFKNGHRP